MRGVLGIAASTVSDETLVAFFEQYDTDASGAIELGELLDFVRRPSSSLSTRARSHARAAGPAGSAPAARLVVGRRGLPIRKLHSRLKAAARATYGDDLQSLFGVLDRDGSGALTASQQHCLL